MVSQVLVHPLMAYQYMKCPLGLLQIVGPQNGEIKSLRCGLEAMGLGDGIADFYGLAS